jgi:hypothetical protein
MPSKSSEYLKAQQLLYRDLSSQWKEGRFLHHVIITHHLEWLEPQLSETSGVLLVSSLPVAQPAFPSQ